MLSIYRKEISSYFNSLIGYLAIAVFLLATGLIVWFYPDTSVIDSGYASLDVFFALAPYMLIFLCPAIMMRSIAGEKSDGTYDLLISRPLSLKQIVLGKFLGGLTVVLLAILPTLVYGFSIYYLAFPVGNIDIGATVGSYLGLILLASTFIAISLFCSSLCHNAIVAFLLAVFVSFFLFYGFGASGEVFTLGGYEETLKLLGIQEHYLAISRGVLLPQDFIYFLSLISIFLIFSIGHLSKGRQKRKKIFSVYLLTLCVAFIVNQPFVYSFFDRIDFTEDKRFTLSDTSKKLVSELDTNVYITIFLDGDLPTGFKRLKQASVHMANNLKSYSEKKIFVNIINPSEGSQEEQKELTAALIGRGLYPTNLNVKTSSGHIQKLIFPFAIVNVGEKEFNVNLLQNRIGQTPEQVLNNSIQNLEYAFVSAISKVSNDATPYIGFTEGHDEASDLELYDAMHSLAVTNQVGRLNLDSIKLEDLAKIKIMIIAKPKSRFSESDKFKINHFVRNGGSVIWAIDQIDASLDNLRETGSQSLIGRDLNLDDLLFMYGIRLNYEIVADLNCSQIPISMGNVGGQSQIELAPWYFYPIVMPNSSNPIVKNLDGIRTEFIGTIDTLASLGINKEILLESSPFTRVFKTPSLISLQMIEEAIDPSKFKSKPATVAVLLNGKFPDLFENRALPAGIENLGTNNFEAKDAKMLVMSDGDWLINQVSGKDQSPFPLGWDRYTEKQYANKIFLENAIDYLMNDEELIVLRNREVKLRLLDQAVIKDSKLVIQLVNVIIPLILIILFGILQQFLRKKKYAN